MAEKSKRKTKYEEQNLNEGDVVEFPRNKDVARFGVVTGGFGMKTFLSGSMIMGVFGATAQEAVDNYKTHLKMDRYTSFEPAGTTRRQECRVVGHVNVKTGKIEKPLQA
jgi:hypothetical protein